MCLGGNSLKGLVAAALVLTEAGGTEVLMCCSVPASPQAPGLAIKEKKGQKQSFSFLCVASRRAHAAFCPFVMGTMLRTAGLLWAPRVGAGVTMGPLSPVSSAVGERES